MPFIDLRGGYTSVSLQLRPDCSRDMEMLTIKKVLRRLAHPSHDVLHSPIRCMHQDGVGLHPQLEGAVVKRRMRRQKI